MFLLVQKYVREIERESGIFGRIQSWKIQKRVFEEAVYLTSKRLMIGRPGCGIKRETIIRFDLSVEIFTTQIQHLRIPGSDESNSLKKP